MLTLITLITLLLVVVFIYMQNPKFGKNPNGDRLEIMKKSPRFKNGKFENTNFTPTITEGYSMLGVLYDQIFKSHPNLKPTKEIPSIKTDLLNLDRTENVIVWFGHSSYFMQLDGKRFLIDPVFSGSASPVPGSVKSFKGSDIYTVNDFPNIDYLLISHDHYDHLDYETIKALNNKVNTVICGLGVGSHFEHWNYSTDKIIEKDWNETIDLGNGIIIHTTPARHFSGRSFSRNNTLWMSYVIESYNRKIYIGGDSGYDTHFKEIGDKYGPFDLAILENGQYNLAWEAIHLLPEQVLKAATDLKAKRLFPVHSSKFVLAMHPWNEPLNEVYKINQGEYNLDLVTPIIGEKVYVDDENQSFKTWWSE
ncbi:MBL fold metallo-hydrolase [Tenacibaculum sp. ZH5_bin.1]|uniref:MBL fold metallo-hydrolase n=1 Tax=Tenacibaculum TaxID=104267 RepID=UPI0018C8829C|nr:MBL fold metallo-hydrolase [Tenacibaculum mesophilum]KAF9658492.1 MBL fold metallo-hydrolase [Tenacibaculum mesophilum]